ncbi:carbohydrate ABC transporter permease [Streptosporangium sp. NPDC050855]|uniref:carbohydrate ABC transporter permease n=1 Tax=Streptosporangium sp. NPDC050855 TaxID=3366194 RepID=UPI0037B22FF4
MRTSTGPAGTRTGRAGRRDAFARGGAPPRGGRRDAPVRRALARLLVYLSLVVAGAVVILPLAAILLTSLRTAEEMAANDNPLAALVPGVTTQVATYQVVNGLGVMDTHWAPVLLYTGTDIVSIYIFLQFIRSIPMSLDEAARLDGATSLTIYWRVIMPLLRPAIATVVIVKGVAIYNDFYIPFLFMPSEGLGTISTSLFRFKGPYGAHWEVISAGAALVILPSLIVFLALQRFIYSGLVSGATK